MSMVFQKQVAIFCFLLPISFRINGSISSFRIKSYNPWYDIKAPVNERIQKDGGV